MYVIWLLLDVCCHITAIIHVILYVMLYNCYQTSDVWFYMLCYITVIRGMITVIWCQTSTNSYITVVIRRLVWKPGSMLSAAFIENVLILKFAYGAEKLPLGLSINGFLDDTNLCIAQGLSDIPQKNLWMLLFKKKQLTLLYVHLTSLCASVLWAKLVEEHCYRVYSPTELQLPRH